MKGSFASLAAILLSAIPLAASTVIYNNVDSSWTSNMSVSSYFYQAQSFHTGAETTYLSKVSLGLLGNDGTNSPFLVQIYSGLHPGLAGLIATLDGPSNPGTGLIPFTAGSSLLLDSDTTYWVCARASNATASGTYYGWIIADQEPSTGTDSGRNMYYADSTNQWVGPTGPGDFIMQVEVVPEPASTTVLALSFLLLVGIRRRN